MLVPKKSDVCAAIFLGLPEEVPASSNNQKHQEYFWPQDSCSEKFPSPGDRGTPNICAAPIPDIFHGPATRVLYRWKNFAADLVRCLLPPARMAAWVTRAPRVATGFHSLSIDRRETR